ncbi:hypothetical protein [Escherichia coli]|uniref:hypothetical protein n=1 Tax=Escherichia coli TaxID=562 RepID=UPI003D1F68FC
MWLAENESLFRILCKCLFSEVAVQAVTELDNKAAHCHRQSFNGIVHFWDADWIELRPRSWTTYAA